MDKSEQLAVALRAGDDGDQLRDWVKAQFEGGLTKKQIVDTINEARERLDTAGSWRERDEDGFVNVLDAMHGWCLPSGWLCPPD